MAPPTEATEVTRAAPAACTMTYTVVLHHHGAYKHWSYMMRNRMGFYQQFNETQYPYPLSNGTVIPCVIIIAGNTATTPSTTHGSTASTTPVIKATAHPEATNQNAVIAPNVCLAYSISCCHKCYQQSRYCQL